MATAHGDSTLITQLTASQRNTGELIESLIRNFKKDSASRKTVSYYEERIRKLDAAWAEFETIDNKIRCLENVPLDHKYFTEGYYEKISELTTKYREMFESAMMGTSTKPALDDNQELSADKPTIATRTSVPYNTPSTSTISLIRRQNAMMSSLKRLLTIDPTVTNMKLKEKLWGQIQDLHFSIWESSNDPLREGYDVDTYTILEHSVIENFKQSPVSEQVFKPTPNNVLPLPNVTIPKFDGDYLKWRPFFDLFSQLVDSQQLPIAQKMWYLKSSLGGEAKKLVSHLSAIAENYSVAWNLLQERYNNPRILVTSLIQQLFDQPNACSSAAAIKQLHDTTQECLHALNNSGIDTTSWDPMLIHILVNKLDRGTRILYERSITNPKELQKIKHLLSFLENSFQSMEATNQKANPSKVCASAASPRMEATCPLCKGGPHQLYRCKGFQQLTPPHRLNYIQKHNLCVNCLKTGHTAKSCTSRSCTKCNKKHNSLLHLENRNHPPRQESIENVPQATSAATISPKMKNPEGASSASWSSEVASLAAANKHLSNAYVLLSTAVVKLKSDVTEIECRALLDSGSQVNLITERLVRQLGISRQTSAVNIHGIGKTNTKTQHRVNVALHSRVTGFSTRLEALVLPRIVEPQPSQYINTNDWPIPKNLMLADPAFNRSNKIDLLLGAEHYHQLLAIGQIKLSKQLPILQNTVFGWIVAGKIHGQPPVNTACGICTAEETLEASITRLWELEEVKSTEKSPSMAETQCEQHFAQNTTRTDQNRFMVRIPFHQSPNTLGESHGIALRRFLALERRLQKNPELKDQYTKFMDEYESMGHMTKLQTESIISPNYFIPHHCVVRPESSTTKLRVVFDASAKTSTGHSLNDLMYTGPTVQSELFSILLRFRMPRFVFTTDVEKMYRQVLVAPEDRQFQLIIWRKDAANPITYYQLNTVTYGTRAAPYLATKCLQQLAKENAIRYPLASQFLNENFYVDDGMGGSDSLVAAIQLKEQLVQIMKKGGFTLRKWCANHPQLLNNIPQDDLEVNLDFESTKVDAIKTLGLIWLPKEDKLGFKVNIDHMKRTTKRTVTSDLARLFDPLGILSPIVVTAKMFIQELWELQLDWDQSLPESLHTKWVTFRTELHALKILQISRHIFSGKIPQSVQLHIFTDASEKAYGAAAYIRSCFNDGIIITRLLCAKSRVAPLKRQTIPRLELCAAALGSKLATRIKSDLQLTSPIWFWTDSEIVLSWIHSSSSSFNTFVANRISIIHETTQAGQWRHVSSKCNPADVLSRGMSPVALKECTLWFTGPPFLHGREEIWPPKFNPKLSTPSNLERKRKLIESLAVTTAEPSFIYKINHKNSFHRLQRIVGYVLRFISHIRCQNHLQQLLMNQTSIIDASLNIFKQSELKMKQKFDNLDNNVKEIMTRLHEEEKELHQTKLGQLFMALSVQLSILSARLHQIQSQIVAALSDSHHGKISPTLLSPSQLQSELIQIRNHLPTSLQLPVDNNNLLQLYKIMSVKGGVTDDHVIFHLSIPLSDPEMFELLKTHPIPARINNTIFAIKPCSDFIAINAHKDQYFTLTQNQWNSCTTLKEGEFLCSHMQSKFNADAEKCLCEISLLNDNTPRNCNIMPVVNSTSLTQLDHNNQWLYTINHPTRISAVCGQEHLQFNLEGSGLLKIKPDCTLKFKSAIIQGHETFSTSLQASYTAVANISDIVYPDEIHFGKLSIKAYADQMKNISELQNKLHQQVMKEFPSQIQQIKYHHATVAYAALVLAIIVSITIAYKRCGKMKVTQQTPRPAVRQHLPLSEFAVTVT